MSLLNVEYRSKHHSLSTWCACELPEYCFLAETCVIRTRVVCVCVCVRASRGLFPALWNPCRVAYLIPDELCLSALRPISYSTHLSDYLLLYFYSFIYSSSSSRRSTSVKKSLLVTEIWKGM